MTTLASHASAVAQMNWPRVGALSGSLSMHLYVLALLFTPPIAFELLKRDTSEPTVVHIIQTPPETLPTTEPTPPVPQRHEKRRTAPPTHTTIPLTETISPTGPVITVDHDPLPSVEGPQTPVEVAPTALAYATRTRVPYPRDALLRGEHGTVVLRVLVGIDGNPLTVEIETSSGSTQLDSAARTAVMHWSFRPGTRDGAAHSAWARVPISFDLSTL